MKSFSRPRHAEGQHRVELRQLGLEPPAAAAWWLPDADVADLVDVRLAEHHAYERRVCSSRTIGATRPKPVIQAQGRARENCNAQLCSGSRPR